MPNHLLKLLQSFLTRLVQLLIKHRHALGLLLLGIFIPLQIFGNLAEEVWEDEGFPWDEPILLAIRSTHNPTLDVIASQFTRLGVFWGVFPVAVVVSLVLLKRRHWRSLSFLVVTLLGSIVINRTVKLSLRRVRPQLWLSPAPEFDYGFPSGHAMSSMTLVAALVVLTWHTRWRVPVLIGGSLFVLAIGWTRLYLGVHYPSDIVAGWMASLAWTIGVRLVLRPNRPQSHTNLNRVHNR